MKRIPVHWMIALLRLPALIPALIAIIAGVLGNHLASNDSELMSASELVLGRALILAVSVPLLLPWRIFKTKGLPVLVVWLWLDALLLTVFSLYVLNSSAQQLPSDVWMSSVLPFWLITIGGPWGAVVAAHMTLSQSRRARQAA